MNFKVADPQKTEKSRKEPSLKMLTGEFTHSIDSKNRMFVPAKFREELGESFVISKSVRGNYLHVLSLSEWEAYLAPIKALPRSQSADTLRYLNRSAMIVTPDSQGRVVLSQALLEYAGITKNAVVIGCGDYAEIWSEESDNSALESVDPEAIRKTLEEFGL